MPIGYVRESWWARNRTYIACLIGVIGVLAGVTIVVLGQTDIQLFGGGLGDEDCGTLFSPVRATDCAGAHTEELMLVVLSAAVVLICAAAIVLIARTRPRRPGVAR